MKDDMSEFYNQGEWMNKKIIAVDFDGTCVTHEYPAIGRDIGAVPVLQQLVKNGHKLICFTMRDSKELDEAKQWFKDNDIELWAANENPTQKSWTKSPKVYAHLYIDDAALGCPLIHGQHERPYVNWRVIEQKLREEEIIV